MVRKIEISIYMANPRWQEDLNSWINAQLQKPRKPFQRDEAIDEILEAFDPLSRGLGAADFAILARIIELYDQGAQGMKEEGVGYVEPGNGALHRAFQNLLFRKCRIKSNERFTPGTK